MADRPPDAQPPPTRMERRISSPEHRAAYEVAKNSPTLHKPKLITTRSVAASVHGVGLIGQINTRLAVVVTKSVGTMWAAYLFALLTLVSLPAAILSHNSIVIISWIAQTFLQLVLLPIIIVGQNVISASQDARAEADHLTLTTLHAINVQQLEILKQHRQILELLQSKELAQNPGTTASS
jgi:hypothetical protein